MNTKQIRPVLRDLEMLGRFELPRRNASSPMVAAAHPEAQVDSGSLLHVAAAEAQRNAGKAPADAQEALRLAFEEGLSRGRSEAQSQAAEMALTLAEQAEERIVKEVSARAERIARDIDEQSKASYQARLQLIDRLMADLPGQIESRLVAAEDDMLALCFEVVCRMLGEKAARLENIRSHLEIAMRAVRSRKLVSVHLHPDDLATLRHGSVDGESAVGNDGVNWVADASIEIGGCILHSDEGGLDARFDTQLEALGAVLKAHRSAARLLGTQA